VPCPLGSIAVSGLAPWMQARALFLAGLSAERGSREVGLSMTGRVLNASSKPMRDSKHPLSSATSSSPIRGTSCPTKCAVAFETFFPGICKPAAVLWILTNLRLEHGSAQESIRDWPAPSQSDSPSILRGSACSRRFEPSGECAPGQPHRETSSVMLDVEEYTSGIRRRETWRGSISAMKQSKCVGRRAARLLPDCRNRDRDEVPSGRCGSRTQRSDSRLRTDTRVAVFPRRTATL